MATKSTTKITTFSEALGWQGRERDFKRMEEVYGKPTTAYSIFKYVKKKNFKAEHKELNTKEEFLYVCRGNLKKLMDDLQTYKIDQNSLYEKEGVLKFKLTQKTFAPNWGIKPTSIITEGVFYQVTEEEFQKIPFEVEPITIKRENIFARNLVDSVEETEQLKNHFATHLVPLQTTEEKALRMKYKPIIVDSVKEYVPNEVHTEALRLAVEHDLTNLQFNFLNYFYLTGKALRNGVGQMYFDENSNGVGWDYSREWVKKRMAQLIDLKLVKFKSNYDCRDPRYTSWYFYDAKKRFNDLKHDF